MARRQGGAGAIVRRLGEAIRSGAAVVLAGGCATLLLLVVAAGLVRDPLAVDPAARLLPPSVAHPLGTDALGRDLLARLGHGAGRTVGLALLVTAAGVLLGLVVGLATRVGAGATDVVATLPAVLAGLLVTAVLGPSSWGAATAVVLVAWTPYAAHCAALAEQERAGTHLLAATALGAGRVHLLRTHVLPAVLPPLLRGAVLRLPTTVLVLASLGFLGLGEQPPSPEWGRLLAEGQPYVELAPWGVLAPALALMALSVLAVTAPAVVAGRSRGRTVPGPGEGAVRADARAAGRDRDA